MLDSDAASSPHHSQLDTSTLRSQQTIRTAREFALLLRQASKCDACVVCGLDHGRDELDLLAADGLAASGDCACDEHSDLSYDSALRGDWVAQSAVQGPVTCRAASEAGLASRLLVPLRWQGRTLGLLQVYRKSAAGFDSHEIESVLDQSRVAAMAFENARLYDRAEVLFQLARTLSSTLDMENIGNLIAEQVTKAMGAKGSTVRNLDRLSNQLQLVGAYGLSHNYLFEKGPVIASASIRDALDGKPTAIYNVSQDPRVQYPAAAAEEGITSIASIPMIVKGVVTGVLRIYTAKPFEFQPDDLAFLVAAAGVAAAAVENARMYDGIRHDFETLMDEIVYVRRAARAVGGSGIGI